MHVQNVSRIKREEGERKKYDIKCPNSLVWIEFGRVRRYNSFLVYSRELAPSTVSLTGDRAQGDDSKHYLHYNAAGKHFTISTHFFNHILTNEGRSSRCHSGVVDKPLALLTRGRRFDSRLHQSVG